MYIYTYIHIYIYLYTYIYIAFFSRFFSYLSTGLKQKNVSLQVGLLPYHSHFPWAIWISYGWSPGHIRADRHEDLDIELEARPGIFEAFGADAEGHLGVSELVYLGYN